MPLAAPVDRRLLTASVLCCPWIALTSFQIHVRLLTWNRRDEAPRWLAPIVFAHWA